MRIKDGAYEHRCVCGEGVSEKEAILDWFRKMPWSEMNLTYWRVKPEIRSEVNFDTKIRIFRVFSRFAIVGLEEEKADSIPFAPNPLTIC